MPEKKEIRFVSERNETLKTLVDILKLNMTKNTIILYYLDKNEEAQKQILSLKSQISQFYSGSSCRALNKKESKRPYMSIIRFLLKEHGYKLIPYDFSIKSEDENQPPIRTKRYQIMNIHQN